MLLMRLPPDRGAWAGKLNGIGGHIEQGEEPRESALREIHEETGLTPDDLRLVGVILIDTGEKPGVALYVFVGACNLGDASAGPEGQPEWTTLEAMESEAMLQDLPTLIPRAMESYQSGRPFSGAYSYDQDGRLQIHISRDA